MTQEVAAPLLGVGSTEKWHGVEQRLGSLGAIQTLVVSMLGTGIVAFPFAFAVCGYILAPILLITVCFLACLSYYSLIRCTHRTRMASYGGLVEELPVGWRIYTKISLWFLLVLVSTAYVVISVDILKSAVLASFGTEAQGSPLLQNRCIFAIVNLAILPLCLLRSFSGLTGVSVYCTVALVAVVGLLVYESLLVAANEPPAEVEAPQPFLTDPKASLLSVPIFACAMFGHMNLSQVYAELRPELKPRAPSIVVISCLLVTVVYLLVGYTGYMAFGQLCLTDVVSQLAGREGETTGVIIIQVLLCSVVIFKIPLVILPLRNLTVELLMPQDDPANLPNLKNFVLTFLLLFSVYAAAMLLPDLGQVLDILGALCVVPLTYIVPACLAWSLEAPRPTLRCLLLAATGIIASSLSLLAK